MRPRVAEKESWKPRSQGSWGLMADMPAAMKARLLRPC
jgi:hypothetical protein